LGRVVNQALGATQGLASNEKGQTVLFEPFPRTTRVEARRTS